MGAGLGCEARPGQEAGLSHKGGFRAIEWVHGHWAATCAHQHRASTCRHRHWACIGPALASSSDCGHRTATFELQVICLTVIISILGGEIPMPRRGNQIYRRARRRGAGMGPHHCLQLLEPAERGPLSRACRCRLPPGSQCWQPTVAGLGFYLFFGF